MRLITLSTDLRICRTMLFYLADIAGKLAQSTKDTAHPHGAVSTPTFTAGLEYLLRGARIALD